MIAAKAMPPGKQRAAPLAPVQCENWPECIPLCDGADGGSGEVAACPGCGRGWCEGCLAAYSAFLDGGSCTNCVDTAGASWCIAKKVKNKCAKGKVGPVCKATCGLCY